MIYLLPVLLVGYYFIWFLEVFTNRSCFKSGFTNHAYDFPDRGILMTFGSGSNGCLGHGDFNDVAQVNFHLAEWYET